MASDLDIIERLRAMCLALPGASEKLSHGEPAFFAGGRQFANLDSFHHGAEHLSVWLAAPPGAQEVLIGARPERFFRPPYRGHEGWVGVILDTDPDWDEVAMLLAEAAAMVSAPKRRR